MLLPWASTATCPSEWGPRPPSRLHTGPPLPEGASPQTNRPCYLQRHTLAGEDIFQMFWSCFPFWALPRPSSGSMLCVGSKRQRLGPGAGGTGQGATGLGGVPAALLELTGKSERASAGGWGGGPGNFLLAWGMALAAAGSRSVPSGTGWARRRPGNGRPAQGLDQPFPAYLTSERGRDEPDRPEAWSSGLRRATRTLLFPGCGDKDELLVELIPHSAP